MEKTKGIERVILNNVSKKFIMNYRKQDSALSRFLAFVYEREEEKEFVALENISFKVKDKEIIGIIGGNGSGKSTLLRIIAGIYQANSGIIETKGKVIYLSGLTNGLQEKLTMRENILLIGSILGLSQRDIKSKFHEIVEFSELKDFVDVPVKQFSSGMVLRLAFSITINCVKHHSPDILLLDEVFNAGGDESFKRKSLEKIEELMKSGATIILVSHDLEIIKKHCNRAIWIEKGKIIKEGNPKEVIDNYIKYIGGKS